ncbi:MAG: hypothetical protein J5855_08035 [Mailhella sp.]|nr:hypothetical protein [Mailhella sp.]
MTEKQLAAQDQEIARLSDELKRLNSMFAEQKKALGLPEDAPVTVDEKEITPELKKAMDAAKAEAEQAGKALAEQLAPSSSAPSSAPRARRGAVRI